NETKSGSTRYKSCTKCVHCKDYYISFLRATQVGMPVVAGMLLRPLGGGDHQVEHGKRHQCEIDNDPRQQASGQQLDALTERRARPWVAVPSPKPCGSHRQDAKQNKPDFHWIRIGAPPVM